MRHYLNLLALFSVFASSRQLQLSELRALHQPQRLTNAQLSYLAKLSNTTNLNDVLDNICIPRVVGSKEHSKVFDYIISQLSSKGWDIGVDKFTDTTPTHGTLTFRNIIATLNPEAERYLVLSCHYDSKYFADFDFVAATDSAVPCAMLINLATVMQREFLQSLTRRDLSLKFIFFDGEEAFKTWAPNDSLYGARHLAQQYERGKSLTKSGVEVSDLDKIDLLILLDLLGDRNPTFYSYFHDTENWYTRLYDAERKLSSLGLLKRKKNAPKYFKDQYLDARIDDDHKPFLARGVPVLHMIPVPFPDFWHKPGDNRSAVDIPTVENLNAILRVFVSEYLHLYILDDDNFNDSTSRLEL